MPDERARRLQQPIKFSGDVYRYESADDDNFTQCTTFWNKVLDDAARKRLVTQMAAHLATAKVFIQERAIANFYKVSPDLGKALSEAVQLRKSSKM